MHLDRRGIALIVQVQIDGDFAGFGFSIKRVSKDFDGAAINFNGRLGASVVFGWPTPTML